MTNRTTARRVLPFTKTTISWRWILSAMVLWGVVLAIMLPMLHYQLFVIHGSDYPIHTNFARTMVEQEALRTPHFLWHLPVASIHAVLDQPDFRPAALIFSSCVYLFLASVLWAMLRHDYAPAHSSRGLATALPLMGALGLMIAAPIFAGFALDHHLYFGYIGWATYHNPTIALLRPLALIHFWLLLKVFAAEQSDWSDVFGLAVLGILATLAKPNYTICILPAAGLFAGYRFLRGQSVKWRSLLLGVIIPLTAILFWQWQFTYSLNVNSNMKPAGIAFQPFVIMTYYSDNLLVKFFCSIAFPAVCYGALFRQARQDVALNLSWLLFGMGMLATYLVAETGPRMLDANFFWSGQITLFVLVVASYRFVARLWQSQQLSRAKTWLLSGIFALHVGCGIIFYIVELSTEHTYW